MAPTIFRWTKIWLDLFGTTTLWGLDMGFWVAMAAVLLIVNPASAGYTIDIPKGTPQTNNNKQ